MACNTFFMYSGFVCPVFSIVYNIQPLFTLFLV